MPASGKFLATVALLFCLAVVHRIAPGAAVILAVALLVLAYWAYGRDGCR